MLAETTRRDATPATTLRVGGLTRLTSIDFPDRLAAVVFCQGCPWRCGYCHNPDLLDASGAIVWDWHLVLGFLRTRQGLLDGVVFSGGEPTLQAALLPALVDVRELGFQTALHTGGMYPERLTAALPLLDWVGLDIKAPSHRYDAVTGTPGSGQRARESLHIALESSVQFEVRTTWHPDLFSEKELLALADELAEVGVRHWVLQECRMPSSGLAPVSQELQACLSEKFQYFSLRRGGIAT